MNERKRVMIYHFEEKTPKIANSAFVAESADIVGDVTIGEESSVWFNTVIRGDTGPIVIGEGVNIQDNSTIHLDQNMSVIIEDNVTVGHGCIIHGATLGKGALIGMGAIILDGAQIGEGAIVGAGSIVTAGKKISPNMLAIGSPAKEVREVRDEERAKVIEGANTYKAKAQIYHSMRG